MIRPTPVFVEGPECVAKTWQESRRRPSATNHAKRVSTGQPHNASNDHQQPLSVPRFPWYY
jgi:hypothetical protein